MAQPGFLTRYADFIASRARPSESDPLYSGRHFGDLAQYLQRPGILHIIAPKSEGKAFIWVYDVGKEGFSAVKRYDDVDVFEGEEMELGIKDDPPEAGIQQLVFLTGNPSPEWLSAAGAKYHIDAEFYQQHLEYRPTGQHDFFHLPSLPSVSQNVITLCFTTIGFIQPLGRDVSRDEIHRVRLESNEQIQRRFRQDYGIAGSSIVRRFYLHDENLFTIEQEASIQILQNNGEWLVIIWMDSGGDAEEPKVPLAMSRTFPRFEFCPTIQRRSVNQDAPPRGARVQQLLAMLPANYGKTLDPKIARSYPLYALQELFDFAASAESQFLNMLKKVLDEQIERLLTSSDNGETGPSMADFQYSRGILDRHIHRSQQILAAIKTDLWKNSQERRTAVLSLAADFEQLVQRAQNLVHICERGMNIVMNNAALLESKKSNTQAQDVAGLTRLGTRFTLLYVPIAFVTSIFGMNFIQFGQGELSIWWYFAFAGPVFVLSCSLLFWDDLVRGLRVQSRRPRR